MSLTREQIERAMLSASWGETVRSGSSTATKQEQQHEPKVTTNWIDVDRAARNVERLIAALSQEDHDGR